MQILSKGIFKPTVLYVEDDAETRNIITFLITGKLPDITLITAENGQQGLEKFRQSRADIVVTDVRMPVMDGIRMAREIRNLNKETRVIITTAVSEISQILEAIEIGVNHYVLKPVDHEKLLTSINSCLTDIAREHRVREQLEFFRQLSRAVDQGPVSIMMTDTQGNIVFVSPGFTRITGYQYAEAVGCNVRFLQSGETAPEEYRRLWETIAAGEEWWGEILNRKKNGELFWASESISPIIDAAGNITHFLSRLEDITEKKQKLETILHLAYYDSLTSLPNQHFFQELLHNALAQAQRHSRMLAVLFLDLDNFKNINDSLGHPVGDQLLKAVALRLKDCCSREGDTVGRRGGDEFVILLPELKDVNGPVRVAQRIIEAFGRAFIVPGHELSISASIGISIFPQDGVDPETLVKKADMAMYRAKEGGRNRYHLYTPATDTQMFERLALESSLRKALERQEFFLHYQPKFNITTGRVTSVEALVRWHHPDMGVVMPTQFIPLAEETGLIAPLGEWVLRTACAQNKAWQDAGYPAMRIAVNISHRQFKLGNLAEVVEKILDDTRLAADFLELEITENILLRNEEAITKALNRVSELGVHISVDDFGTGYSVFSYIRQVPIKTLKIDQSFISDICSNENDEAIASAVINMAQSLKLNVIAEGVETEEQRKLLESLNCSEMQGYFFSRPLPAEDLCKCLDKLEGVYRE